MKTPEEWLRQVDYDFGSAEAMFLTGRYLYAVFMCHLSIEKAFKALYLARLKEVPPKTHNLLFLLERANVQPPESIGRYLVKLNQAHVITRYP